MTKPEQQHTGYSRTAGPEHCDATGADSADSSTSQVKSVVSGEKLRVGDCCLVLPGHGYTQHHWGLVDYEPVQIFYSTGDYYYVRPLLIVTSWSETGYAFLRTTQFLKRIPLD